MNRIRPAKLPIADVPDFHRVTDGVDLSIWSQNENGVVVLTILEIDTANNTEKTFALEMDPAVAAFVSRGISNARFEADRYNRNKIPRGQLSIFDIPESES